ncbi:unnamed protein product [Leptidea sinapis]|uniref:unspecific monooxygenase n=1 Tax=Leptidea sinapis TaxID=189913 RepID=A0A5E4R1T2_9NEOP|nr:unnamed protein product [Leptidea sinapis]
MIFIVLALCALITLYLYGTRNHSYWKKRGVVYENPLPFVGNDLKQILMLRNITDISADLYFKFPNERVVGSYRGSRPVLIVRDPEIIKRILVTDFNYFYPRGLNSHKSVIEPMLRNLFFADGDIWRLLRQRLTPAFSSGKLRAMFPLIAERAELLQTRVLGHASGGGGVVDARDLMARYTTDFIGACGFGLDTDALQDDNSEFRNLGKKIFAFDIKRFFLDVLKECFPNLLKNIKLLAGIERHVIHLLNLVLRQRNYKPSGRNDFIDLLIKCQEQGTIVDDSIEKFKDDGTPETARLEMDVELMAAQMFVFFAAGFETSSSATSFTLNELAHNPRVQARAQEEVDRVLAKYDNKLTYDAVKEMTYLEWTLKEGMRVFPSLGFLIRECARKYTFKELGFSVDEGVRIIIPVQALHNDPQYFDEPAEFRPERFGPDSFSEKNKYVYLPFGAGPRACIGERLGLMQSVAGLAAVLAQCSVSPAPRAPRTPLSHPASGITQNVVGGVPLVFTTRN